MNQNIGGYAKAGVQLANHFNGSRKEKVAPESGFFYYLAFTATYVRAAIGSGFRKSTTPSQRSPAIDGRPYKSSTMETRLLIEDAIDNRQSYMRPWVTSLAKCSKERS
jgi:hypothetical protein